MNKRQLTVSAVILAAVIAFAMTACKEPETPPEDHWFSYPSVTLPSATLNFNPVGLPAGITYTINDENGPVTHTNGVVSGSSYGVFSDVVFTQIFFKDSKDIGRLVLQASTNSGANFDILADVDDNIVYKIPDVKLTY